jgi:hypothetical protein
LVVDGKKIDSVLSMLTVKNYAIKWVPIIEEKFILKDTVDEMIAYATGESVLYPTLREGVVIRDVKNTISFKCISPEFLIKWDL